MVDIAEHRSKFTPLVSVTATHARSELVDSTVRISIGTQEISFLYGDAAGQVNLVYGTQINVAPASASPIYMNYTVLPIYDVVNNPLYFEYVNLLVFKLDAPTSGFRDVCINPSAAYVDRWDGANTPLTTNGRIYLPHDGYLIMVNPAAGWPVIQDTDQQIAIENGMPFTSCKVNVLIAGRGTTS